MVVIVEEIVNDLGIGWVFVEGMGDLGVFMSLLFEKKDGDLLINLLFELSDELVKGVDFLCILRIFGIEKIFFYRVRLVLILVSGLVSR